MHELTCPHCHKAFTKDDAGYPDLVKQVRNSELETDLHKRLTLAETEKRHELALAAAKLTSDHKGAQAKQALEIERAAATSNLTELSNRRARAV